jgi:hypothetical protein
MRFMHKHQGIYLSVTCRTESRSAPREALDAADQELPDQIPTRLTFSGKQHGNQRVAAGQRDELYDPCVPAVARNRVERVAQTVVMLVGDDQRDELAELVDEHRDVLHRGVSAIQPLELVGLVGHEPEIVLRLVAGEHPVLDPAVLS